MKMLCVLIYAAVLGVGVAQDCSSCTCYTVYDTPITITSPNYPNNYAVYDSVCWIFTSGDSGMYPRVASTAFNTESSYDKVEIYSDYTGNYLLDSWSGLGQTGLSQTSTTNKMRIDFNSDSTQVYSGFSLIVGVVSSPSITTTTYSIYNNNRYSGSSGLEAWHFGLIGFAGVLSFMIILIVLSVLRGKGIIKGRGSRGRRGVAIVVPATSHPPPAPQPAPVQLHPPQQQPMQYGSSINNNPNYSTTYSDPAYPPGANPAPPPQNIYASAAVQAAS